MSNDCHVLVRRVLGTKLTGASLASEARRPVIRVVHVLIASTLGTEGSGAGLAFGPVVIVLHMLLAIIFKPERGRAGLALVHFGNGNLDDGVYSKFE